MVEGQDDRVLPVRAVEGMQYFLPPAPVGLRHQLEYRAKFMSTGRGSIEIAGCIEEWAASWITPIVSLAENVHYLFAPTATRFWRQFEDKTLLVRSIQRKMLVIYSIV